MYDKCEWRQDGLECKFINSFLEIGKIHISEAPTEEQHSHEKIASPTSTTQVLKLESDKHMNNNANNKQNENASNDCTC